MKFEWHTPWRFIVAVWRAFVEFWRNRDPLVSPDQYIVRITTCYGCRHYIVDSQQCGLCTCFIPLKAKLSTEQCPDTPSRWPVL